jgi:replicative DNA helicase
MEASRQQGKSMSVQALDALLQESQMLCFTRAKAVQAAKTLEAEGRKEGAWLAVGEAVAAFGNPGMGPDLIADLLRGACEKLEGESLPVGFGEAVEHFLAELDRPESYKKPLPLPWACVNRILRGGMVPGELCVLAARPSVGKTAFALNVALSMAASGKSVVMASLEMTQRQLMERLVSNFGSIPFGDFREYGLSGDLRAMARQAAEGLRGLPLHLTDSANVRPSDVRRLARDIARSSASSGGLGLVVVDYLGLMTPDERLPVREREVAEMSRAMKLLAKEVNAPVLLLHQLNRRVEETNREPRLSDLRESGAIEQDADIVMFLHPAKSAWNERENIKLIVAKGRSSGVGAAYLVFAKRYQRFDEGEEQTFTRAAKTQVAMAQGRFDE